METETLRINEEYEDDDDDDDDDYVSIQSPSMQPSPQPTNATKIVPPPPPPPIPPVPPIPPTSRVAPQPIPFSTDTSVRSLLYETKLFADDGVPYQKYGHTVVSNDYLVVTGTASLETKPKVYLYNPTPVKNISNGTNTILGQYNEQNITEYHWKLNTKLFSDTTSNDGYGSVLSLSNEFLVVGAPADDKYGYGSGAVYIYPLQYGSGVVYSIKGPAGTVIYNTIRATSPRKGMFFGSALAITGQTLFIGAPGDNTYGPSSGSVFQYQYSEKSKSWNYVSTTQDLQSGHSYELFGSSLAVTDELLAIGATGYTTNFTASLGAVFIYYKPSSSQSSYVFSQLITPTQSTSHALFGRTLLFTNDYGFIGAFTSTGSGVVYVYTKTYDNGAGSSNMWSCQSQLLPTKTSDPFNKFGASLAFYQTVSNITVATNGAGGTSATSVGTANTANIKVTANNLIIGSPGDDHFTELGGAVYYFRLSNYSPTLLPSSTPLVSSRSSVILAGKVRTSGRILTSVTPTWTSLAIFSCNVSQEYMSFGSSVNIFQNRDLFVGAELDDSPKSTAAGSLYLENNLLYYMNTVTASLDEASSVSVSFTSYQSFASSPTGLILIAFVPLTAIAIVVLFLTYRTNVFRNYKAEGYTTATVTEGSPSKGTTAGLSTDMARTSVATTIAEKKSKKSWHPFLLSNTFIFPLNKKTVGKKHPAERLPTESEDHASIELGDSRMFPDHDDAELRTVMNSPLPREAVLNRSRHASGSRSKTGVGSTSGSKATVGNGVGETTRTKSLAESATNTTVSTSTSMRATVAASSETNPIVGQNTTLLPINRDIVQI